jgi:alkyl sulfatase BDS1-like metallo-beta-lactamase superfamily hydrolase
MPVTYLSDEWFAAAADAFAALPERPGATATIQRVITGSPDGDIAYHLTLEDGRVVGVERGTDDAAQVTLTLPYKDALRVEKGECSLNVLYMQGRLKVAGSTGAVLAYLPVTVTPEYEAAQARLGADLEG